jgi:hypothetical protein
MEYIELTNEEQLQNLYNIRLSPEFALGYIALITPNFLNFLENTCIFRK